MEKGENNQVIERKTAIGNLLKNPNWCFFIEITRFLLAISMVVLIILVIVYKNQVLADPCTLCMNKTGASCMYIK